MQEHHLPQRQEHIKGQVLRQHTIEISTNQNLPSVSIIGVIQLVTVHGFSAELTLKLQNLIQFLGQQRTFKIQHLGRQRALLIHYLVD